MKFITSIEMLFESESTSQIHPLKELAVNHSKSFVEVLEDPNIQGNIHYIITYNNDQQRQIILPKNQPSTDWGYALENFLYPWRLLYDLFSQEYSINDQKSHQTTDGILDDESYKDFQEEFDEYFYDELGFRETLLCTNSYYDLFLDEEILVQESLPAFKKILLN